MNSRSTSKGVESAKQKALEYLSRFSRTERQVALYLSRKGFARDEISNTLSYLHDHGYVNDQAFAAFLIQSRIDRCDGPLKIKQSLFQKGIDLSTANRLLSELYPSELQLERVTALLRKKKGDPQKLWRFLASRGFPRYVIIQALKERNRQDAK